MNSNANKTVNNNKPRTRIARLWQIRQVFRKHHLAGFINCLTLPLPLGLAVRAIFGSGNGLTDKNRGRHIRQALEELGPVFVKLGQALSTRPDLLPVDIVQELTKLQDEVPAFDNEQALKIIRDSYQDNVDNIFASIDESPLASASVAQVHCAKLKPEHAIEGKNGIASEDVIIKILRPGIEQTIKSDLQVMYLFAGLLEKYWQRSAQLRPLDVIKEYDATISNELDLRREAANCVQMGTNFIDSDIIYVPQIYWDFTQEHILVMERIYGTSIREIDALKAQGCNLEQLAYDGVSVFFKQAFEDNFFHADMHPGNIYVSDQGKWIALDFGIMGTLTDTDKQYLAENLLGFFHRDYRAIAKAHARAGWIPQGTDLGEFEGAIRTVCEPIFAKPISQISFGNVLMQLFNTVRQFEIPVQPQLVLLYKTLLNIEGLGRQLYPDLNLWDTAKPFLEDWMKKQLEPKYLIEELQQDWPRWRALLPKLPEYIGNTMHNMDPAVVAENELRKQRFYSHQQDKQNRIRFHQTLGFSVAFFSAALLLLEFAAIITESRMTQLAPLTIAGGLLWAWFSSRSKKK